MSKLSILAFLSFVCLIFVGLTQSTPLNPLEKRFSGAGAVAYCDFKDEVTGRFTWTNIPGNKCRITGQFNTGLTSPDVKDYTFFLEDDKETVVHDLTDDIAKQIHINVPGCSPYQCDFPFSLTSVKDVTGLCFVVKMKGKTLSKGIIEGV
uniref:Gamma-aminobutyric acid receptor subunit beta n=1 Tax=Anthurium amnicola TaxID=1678845 RepID=A0A1D1XV61_9ARAE